MAKRQRPIVKIPDVHKLFVHAECFRVTSELLWSEWKEGKVCYAYPFFVNDALCCELFLKCLAAARTNEHPSGHRLNDLYRSLPEQDRRDVERHYERLSSGDIAHEADGAMSPSGSNSLEDFFTDGADVFELIRYWYERPIPDRRGRFHYPILAIKETILEINPHWRVQSELWT